MFYDFIDTLFNEYLDVLSFGFKIFIVFSPLVFCFAVFRFFIFPFFKKIFIKSRLFNIFKAKCHNKEN